MHQLNIIRPFQTIFRIMTDCDDLAKLLKEKYGKYVSYNLASSYNYEITALKHSSLYEIHFNKMILKSSIPLRSIDKIITDNTQYDNQVFALHGSAIEWNDRAYLFLGSSHAGKSTLISYLVSCGMGYLTDDCVLVNRENFFVYPYSIPIQLRKGGYNILSTFELFQMEDKFNFNKSIQRYVYTPTNVVDKAIPLANIYFIMRSTTRNQIVHMNASERLLSLMRSPITNYVISGDYIRSLSQLSQNNCYKLIYSDMKYIADIIYDES